jgi:hypothetical protein
MLFACAILPSDAEDTATFKTPDPGKGVVEVGGMWHFHTGDNLAWAQPGFDDSGWEKLRGDQTWGAQTHPGYIGFAWYRKPIEVTSARGPITILVPPIQDAYELYWNGTKIGGRGKLPPDADWDANAHAAIYTLPSASGMLAVRVWKATLASPDSPASGGMIAAPRIGDATYLNMLVKTRRLTQDHRLLPELVSSTLMFVTGLLSLLAFARERKRWLYLWMAIYLISIGVFGIRVFLRDESSFFGDQLIVQIVSCMSDLSLWVLLLTLFGLDQEKVWRRWTWILAGIYCAAQVIDIATLAVWQHGGQTVVWIDAVTTAVYTITPLYIIALLIGGLRRKRQMDLWPLAFIVFTTGLWVFLIGIIGQGLQLTHWDGALAAMGRVGFSFGDYRFDMRPILETLLFAAMVFTVARQQYLERRRQAQIDLEVKSAREVQQVLVPETVPSVPGFAIDSVYKPAAELGGDFFQVISLQDESTLIVLGDVSGKGLKAAMTVSLIVGTLRTLADYTHAPAEVLQGLNRRLCGRVQDGFATCVVLRLKPNGEATIANGGHLAPFRDGEELPLRGSLPLGLSIDSVYDELAFRLLEGETLMLYTDGIVEARNATGELYGFERVQRLTHERKSAEEIVEAACAFGQQDDITVLSIRRLAAAEEPAQARVNLTAQIAAM